MNEIVFPAAILQPAVSSIPTPTTPPTTAASAPVISHEIGHGFDDQGAKYDGDGNLVDWWSEADRNRIDKRAKPSTSTASSPSTGLDPEHTVNGEFTIGENIGGPVHRTRRPRRCDRRQHTAGDRRTDRRATVFFKLGADLAYQNS